MKLIAPLFCTAVLLAQPVIHHQPPDYLVSGHRSVVAASITSPDGIHLARTYFKATDTEDYHFVDMPCEGTQCRAVLPKATPSTKGVQYQILFVDPAKKIYKTQPFRVAVDNTRPVPPWQQTRASGRLAVKTELPDPPKQVEGFRDDMTYDTVESSARFGTSAGLYALLGKKGGAVSVAAADSATATGLSTTTMAWIGGGALLVGGGVALGLSASGGGDDDGDTGEPIACDATTDDPQVTLRWNSTNDLDLIVEDPCGNRIHFDSPSASCQGFTGSLTQSANAQFAQSSPSEVVNYPDGGPTGEFKVYVADTLNRDGEATAFDLFVTNQCATAQASGSVEPDALTSVSRFTH